MNKLPDAICFCPILDIVKNTKFNLLDKKMSSISLTSLPIDSRDRFFISNNIPTVDAGFFLTSPLCGLDELGLACACSVERNHKPLVYGFSHSVYQPVNAATIASIWLSFSAALLVAKIKLKAEREFFSYGCFHDNDFVDVKEYISSIQVADEMRERAYADFMKKDFTSISAISEFSNSANRKIKPWLYSFSKISDNNWRFPSQSLKAAASLDCIFLIGCQEKESSLIPKIDRSHWRLNAFDPVVASIHGHCAKELVKSGNFFSSSNGIVGEKINVKNSIADLWHEMMDLSKSLVSERVKWESSKSAVRNWYAAKLRKYNNG